MANPFLVALDQEIALLEAELKSDIRYQRLEEAQLLRALYPREDPFSPPVGSSEPISNRMGTKRSQSERERIIEGAEMYVRNRVGPVPTIDILDHLDSLLGIKIGGERPVNNLSATLSTSGKFRANGRRGWTLASEPDYEPNAQADQDAEDEGEASPTDSDTGGGEHGDWMQEFVSSDVRSAGESN